MSDLERSFKFRAATNRDVPAIKVLVFSVLSQYGLQPDPRGTDADLDDLQADYFQGGGYFEVIENVQGEIVGTIGLVPLEDKRVELRKMYLAAGVRRQGLGKRMLQRALRQARERGFVEVWLETNSVLREAIQLYESHGFKPTSSAHLSKRCDQAYLLRL